MHPKLLEIPFIHLPIYAYGFMVMMGFLTAIFITSRRAERDNMSPEMIFDLGLIAMISGIVGARILYIIYFSETFSFGIFNIGDGGLSITGAVIGFFIPLIIRYLRLKRPVEDKNHSQAQSKQPTVKAMPLTFAGFITLTVISIVSAFILARIVYLALNHDQYNWDLFYVWQGGLVFYGGVILSVICIITYLRMHHVNVLKLGDLAMPAIIFGVAFGRIGCFLNGCCYGKVSTLPWSVCFPVIRNDTGHIIGSPAFVDQLNQHLVTEGNSLSLPVQPTELYESLSCILFFVILSIMWGRKKRFDEAGKPVEATHGIIVAWAGILYSIERFLDEALRGDNKSFIGGFSYSQLVSIGLLIVCIGLLIWVKSRRKTINVAPQPAAVAQTAESNHK